MLRHLVTSLICLVLLGDITFAEDWKVGAAQVNITPTEPMMPPRTKA